jgi:hypothetical protein
MELYELHVLQWQAGAQDHGVAIAGAAMSTGTPEVSPPVPTRGEDRLLGSEAMKRSVFEAKSYDTDTPAAIVHHQVERKIFDKKNCALV